MSRLFQNLLVLSVIGTLTAGCVFSLLEEDLDQLGAETHLFTGKVSTATPNSHAIVVVAMHDMDGADIASFRLLGSPGVFEIRSDAIPTRFFAFMENGGAGVHFLEPYDPDRVPVLFVHGFNGSPLDFRTMLSSHA